MSFTPPAEPIPVNQARVHVHVGRLEHWKHVLKPPPGWADTVLSLESGNYSFEIPGRPDARKGMPWPTQWMLSRVLTVEEEIEAGRTKGGDDKYVGWEVVTADCVETGIRLTTDNGIRCARCGDPVAKSRIFKGLEAAPFCQLCRLVMMITGTRPTE